MDTATVLEIIRILDTRINLKPDEYTTMSDSMWIKSFRDHLQEFVERQISAYETEQSIGE